MKRFQLTVMMIVALSTCLPLMTLAADVNTYALSINGWYSDDTRADGTGTQPLDTNLVSPTLTDDPEATASGNPAHDADIQGQIDISDTALPVAPPAGTWTYAAHMQIATGVNPGKSQISHRKDDGIGHAAGSVLAPGFSAVYSWMGNGTTSVTASLKIGFKTSEFGTTPVSSRTGENAWDKLLIYEPGNGNGGVSDGSWYTETITYDSGNWWLVDRTNGVNSQANDMTLSQMATETSIMIGSRTIQEVFNLLTAAGSHITTIQFGIGSFNAGGSVYVNQLEANFYRPGDRTTFGGDQVPVELIHVSVD